MSHFARPAQRKWLMCHDSDRGARLAYALLVLVCAQGCLVPQSVDPIVVSPHPAPHFVLESIPTYMVTPVLQLVRQGSLDPPCHCELQIPSLTIEEDDPTVDLEARWFIDYNADLPASQVVYRNDKEVLRGTFDDATRIVRQVPEFSFDADLYNINTNGLHKLEVVVGETAAFDDGATAALPNRTPKAGYSLAVYAFTINVDVNQDVAHCPQKLPSVQVCQ